jgi:hypothetical protein
MIKHWHQLKDIPRETRSLANDSCNFLHLNPLMDELTPYEQAASYELVALSINECFIYFEQSLLYAERFLKTEKSEREDLAQVNRDELDHIEAFRSYNLDSPCYQDFYRVSNKRVVRPGQRVKAVHPLMHRLSLFLIRLWPETIFLGASLLERMTTEISKLLLKDHGKDCDDQFVQAHRLHLIDEITHIKVCEEHALEGLKRTPMLLKPFFIMNSILLTLILMMTSISMIRGIERSLPSIRRHPLRRIRFWLAALGLTDKKTPPMELALKEWVGTSLPRFLDLSPHGRFVSIMKR